MNLSLAALAPLLVALVVVVALALDVMLRLRRLRLVQDLTPQRRRHDARRPALALVASADSRWPTSRNGCDTRLMDSPADDADLPDRPHPQRRA